MAGLVFVIFRPDIASAQCPAVGQANGCNVIITITNTGASVSVTGEKPYDGVEDMLVGVVNNSSLPIRALELRSGMGIFNFDGDGITMYGIAGNAMDGTGYGGPNAYFTAIDFTKKTGTVNFIASIAPFGGTGFFSLEEALKSAVSCSSVINKSVKPKASGAQITATFIPRQGYTLQEAAVLCGFVDFDWIQKVTHQNDPSKFFARNLNGAFDAGVNGPVRLSSSRTPYSDPPQGGGYTYTAAPDNSYPFYYDITGELAGHKVNATTLNFLDAPGDGCLPGGSDANKPPCLNTVEPAGSFGGYTTHLAGVMANGGAVDLNIGFTWTSTFNGTTGGIHIKKTDLSPDPGSGTGDVVITGTMDDTDYDFNGLEIISVNGLPVTPVDVPAFSMWSLIALAFALFGIAVYTLREA